MLQDARVAIPYKVIRCVGILAQLGEVLGAEVQLQSAEVLVQVLRTRIPINTEAPYFRVNKEDVPQGGGDVVRLRKDLQYVLNVK